MADDDFHQNPFYIALTKQYDDLYRKACERKCIICVPRASSLPLHKKSNSLLIKRAELGLHILMPSPLQAVKDGLHDCVQKGYSVVIDSGNGCILGYAGFSRGFSAKILSEEKCYDDDGHSFTLLLIDRPLGGDVDSPTKATRTLDYSFSTLSAASCEEYLRDCLAFHDSEQIIGHYKKSIEQYYRTYLMLHDYIDDLANKLRALVNKTVETEIVKASSGLNRKDVAVALEVYGHNILFHKIFDFLREKVHVSRDEAILKNMGSVVRPRTVDGMDICAARFPRSEEFFAKVWMQPSPLQQLLCFSRGIQGLQEDMNAFHKEQLRLGRTTTKSIRLTADDVLNLVLFVLATKKTPFLSSVLAYISVFCFTIPDNSLQYSLTTLEAAVGYLERPNDSNVPALNNHAEAYPINSVSWLDSPADTAFTAKKDADISRINGRPFTPPEVRVPLLLSKDISPVKTSSVSKSRNPSPLDFFATGLQYGTQK